VEKSRRRSISTAFLYCFSGRRIGELVEEGWREGVEVEVKVGFLIRGVRGMMGPVSGLRTRCFVR